MSPVAEFACCLPVLLLWLGPVAFVAVCGVSGGCSRVARYLRRPQLHG